MGHLRAEIIELRQHIVGGAEVQGGLVVRILKAAARLDDAAVDGVLRLLEVDVAGGHHRPVQRLAQLHHLPVEVLDLLQRVHGAVAQHEFVVAQRLNLQKVVVGGNALQLVHVPPGHNGPVQLAGLAGGPQQQALPILVQQAAGHTGALEEILGVGRADDFV